MSIIDLRLLAAPIFKKAGKIPKTLNDFELSRKLVKEIRIQIMQEFRVYVTTCGTASNQRVMFADDCFYDEKTD
jgi:hypothetical protein